MNNTKKTLKNSFVSVIAEICILALQFINRKVFILFLDIEFLGYQTIFSNIFGLLSVAELGIGGIISFHLYKEVINNNKEEIGKLMYLYKWLYRFVASFVLITGLCCYPILPYIVKRVSINWNYLSLIYFLQLTSVVTSYFLSYRRTIYIVTQQEYKCVQTDLYVNVFIQILQLTFLAITRNYIIYLILQLSTAIISNIIISKRVRQEFPFVSYRYSVSKKDMIERNMFSDLGNFLIHRISYAIYGSTDNIIISAFCGVRSVALYGNYVLIQKGVMQILFYKLLNPVQATIGNILYSGKEKESLWKQFEILDVFSFFFASYIGLGFLVFYQPFIQLWLGEEYLLPYSFVIIFSILIYFGAVFEIVYKYRCAFGDYKQDKWCMVISAIMNIIVSIPGAIYFGVTGVLIGTVFAYVPIALGRIRFIVKNYFGKPMSKYLLKHTLLFFFVCIEGYILCLMTNSIKISILGLLMRCVLWLFFPLILNSLIQLKNPYFADCWQYLVEIFHILKMCKRPQK